MIFPNLTNISFLSLENCEIDNGDLRICHQTFLPVEQCFLAANWWYLGGCHSEVCVVPLPGRASPWTSSPWAPARRGWCRAAPGSSSASATSQGTSASPSTLCGCPDAVPSVGRRTRKCTTPCSHSSGFALNVQKPREGKKSKKKNYR